MSGLTRKAPPLLRTVGGRPHASDDDHQDSPRPARRPARQPARSIPDSKRRSYLPTPDSLRSSQSEKEKKQAEEEEDYDRPPESSSDGEEVKVGFVRPEDIALSCEEETGRAAKKFIPPRSSLGSLGSGKREIGEEDEESEPDWMPDLHKPKRPKITGGASVNIHAKPKPATQLKYGKTSAPPPKKPQGFQAPKVSKMPVDSPERKPKGFKKPAVLEFFEGSSSGGFKSSFSNDSIVGDSLLNLDEDPRSPSPEEEEDHDEPDVFSPFIKCPHCAGEVSRMTFEDFAGRHGFTDSLPYKWERRFCHHHKKLSAEETWKEKGYPNILWSSLERRMRKHDEFLIRVLNDTVESHYRMFQVGKLQGRKKGVLETYEAEDEDGYGAVGYYGPRGAKMMTDHIMERFSDDLRQRATVDKLVSSSGLLGGVTGFVQAVMVPHLAELLIKEDMKLTGDWEAIARGIISESAEVGELMHPEARDQIEDGDVVVVGDDD